MKYPHIKQHDEKDCGAACLSMISDFYNLKLPMSKFRELIKVDNQGASIYGIISGSEQIGFDADALEGDFEELIQGINDNSIKFPFIARIINDDMFEHFIVVYDIKNNIVTVGDPSKERITKIELEKFAEQWQGQIITFSPNNNFRAENKRKGSLSKFFKFITDQKKALAIIFVMSIVISLISIFSSQLFEYVIDDAMMQTELIEEVYEDDCEEDHENESTLESIIESIDAKLSPMFENINTLCISIIVLLLIRGLLQIIRGCVLSVASAKVDIPLTLGYYDHLIDLPVEFYSTRKTGELMSRFSDTSKIRDAVSTTTLTIMIDTLMAILTGIYLCIISGTLFIISCIIVLIYAAIIFIFKNPIKYINYDIMEKDAKVESYLKESIDGAETIKTYQYEKTAKHQTKHLFINLINDVIKGSIIYTIQDALVVAVAAIGVVCLLWSGTYLCLKEIITIGELISFYYLLSYFFDPVKNLIDLQPTLQTAMVAADRLNDVLEAEIENHKNKNNISDNITTIEFKDINFRYGHRDLVLKDLNMEINRGEKVAIIGESGCGKTTLAKLLMAFYKPEYGEILINDVNLQDYSLKSIRNRITYVSQDVFLFSDTIYNNLRMGNEDITDEQIHDICKLCNADEFIQKLPLSYNTALDENGGNLSGGQKQRLALARALLKKPDILIMDEATGNLDTITEESIINLMDSLSSEMTLIIIAHRLKTIRNCDYIYVMDEGTVVEEGTHDQLINKKGLYFKYYNI